MSAPREPLTHEERDLAARLARLGASAGPPAALDERILAAAHAAAGSPRVSAVRAQRRPRRRWPLALGAAATVALAVGIAWQLRPVQNAQTYSEAPAVRTPRGSGPSAAEELPAAAEAPAAADSAAMPVEPTEPPQRAPAPAEPEVHQLSPPQVMRQQAPPEAFPRQEAANAPPPAPVSVPAAPPPPPADPAAAEAAPVQDIVFEVSPTPTPQPAASAAANSSMAGATQARRAKERAADAKAGSGLGKIEPEPGQELDRIEVTGARANRDAEGFDESALDDEPPATADSPQVQHAWLQRIRELVSAGDATGAKASLAEFKRRNPHYALPEDLRDLAP